ncbi:MAG: uroporphyrinogen-III synthase [Campylobacterales bacterium]|nr:uroporphyrinogen-III synthase [Campylobacterales bacterium]
MGITLPIYLCSKTPHTGVMHLPLIISEPLHVSIEWEHYDVLVLSSQESVGLLGARVPWERLEVLAVSKRTAEAAQRAGALRVASAAGSGEGLYALIKKGYADRRVLYVSAQQPASDFDERLRLEGVRIERIALYATGCNAEMTIGEIEDDAVVIFTSPSSVECFLKRYRLLDTHRVIAIGPTTAAALPLHVKPKLPESPSIEACVALAKSLA